MTDQDEAAFEAWFNEKHDWKYDPSCVDLYEKHARRAFLAGWSICASDARIAELEAALAEINSLPSGRIDEACWIAWNALKGESE